MSSTQVEAEIIAQGLAEHALRDAAVRAVREDVKRHLADLADVVAARPTFHVIDFAAHGWTIMHPLIGCGLNLFDCPVNEAAERGLERPDRYARFRCDVDAEGRLVVGEEISGE